MSRCKEWQVATQLVDGMERGSEVYHLRLARDVPADFCGNPVACVIITIAIESSHQLTSRDRLVTLLLHVIVLSLSYYKPTSTPVVVFVDGDRLLPVMIT